MKIYNTVEDSFEHFQMEQS